MKNPEKRLNLGVLVSGRGTNLEAIIRASEKNEIPAVVKIVISNNLKAYALERARNHQIPTVVVSDKGGEREIIEALEKHNVDLVCLAGYMKILSPDFIKKYPQRIINIHPSLLPAFSGLHAQAKALEYGVKITGATVHFVDEGCDSGPIILQSAVPVLDGDTLEILKARILKEEHKLYPEAIQRIATEGLKIIGRRVIKKNSPSLKGRGLGGE